MTVWDPPRSVAASKAPWCAGIVVVRIGNMARSERRVVKTAVERALLSIEEHTNESLSPLGTLQYGRDAATFVDEMQDYSSGHKPRLSRILISVGLFSRQITDKSCRLF